MIFFMINVFFYQIAHLDMEKNLYTLVDKIALTDDVWELVFISATPEEFRAGQFITFFLDDLWARAYSILKIVDNKYHFIIKKIDILDGWKWGSKYLCELDITSIISWIGPIGAFTLQNNNNSKLFLGTWTGFVPLWNQITSSLNHSNASLKLIFWVRSAKDVFYKKSLEDLSRQYKNFSFEYYISREDIEGYKRWRISKFLEEKTNIESFREFYICWNPNMVDDVSSRLKKYWKTNIYFEKY